MIRFILLIAAIIIILLILRYRSKVNTKPIQSRYKVIIITVIILGLLFLVATSGRYILPQILQLIKLGLPFLTKLIGV